MTIRAKYISKELNSKMNDEISADVRRRFFGEFGGELKAALKEAPWDVWLVGGAVRSLRWNCPVKDWDLLCDCGDKKAVKSFAEALCRRLEASFVVLDELHGIYRAVDRCRRQLDFCTRAGACLQDDLNRRDFTINTLAVCLNGDLPVRGAEHAGEDIDGRRLRAVSAEAMLEDPVRIFRAWRFLAEYAERVGLIPHEALAGQLLQAQKLIFASAPERIWDELSRTLACPIIPVWDFLCQSGLSDFFGAQKFDDVYNLIKNFEKIAEDKFSELPKSGRMLYDWFNSGIGKTGRTYFSSFKLALLCGWNQVCGRAACGGHAVSASEADGGFREACRTCAEEWSSRLKLAVSEKKLLAELFAAAGEALRL